MILVPIFTSQALSTGSILGCCRMWSPQPRSLAASRQQVSVDRLGSVQHQRVARDRLRSALHPDPRL